MSIPKALQALLERMTQHERIDVLDGGGLREFLAGHDKLLLGFFSDPATHPENLDLAVILPELLKAFPTLRAAIPGACAPLETARSFGVSVFPALVMIQGGQPVQVLERIRSWPEYASSTQEFLKDQV